MTSASLFYFSADFKPQILLILFFKNKNCPIISCLQRYTSLKEDVCDHVIDTPTASFKEDILNAMHSGRSPHR